MLNESDIDSLGVLVGNLLELAGSEASAGEINKLLRKLSAEFDKRETWRLNSLYALIENAQNRNLQLLDLGLDRELLASLNITVDNKNAKTVAKFSSSPLSRKQNENASILS